MQSIIYHKAAELSVLRWFRTRNKFSYSSSWHFPSQIIASLCACVALHHFQFPLYFIPWKVTISLRACCDDTSVLFILQHIAFLILSGCLRLCGRSQLCDSYPQQHYSDSCDGWQKIAMSLIPPLWHQISGITEEVWEGDSEVISGRSPEDHNVFCAKYISVWRVLCHLPHVSLKVI